MHSNHPRTPEGNKKKRKLFIWLSSSLVTSFIIGLILFSTFRPDTLISFVDINEGSYVLEEGQSAEVFFRASDELGSFIYVSYDPRVVRFVENRLIAVGPGTTTIMVSSTSNPRAFDTATVTVRQPAVSPIEPEPEPEVPKPVEPELEVPVDSLDPETEVPVDVVDPREPGDEVIVTPPTIYTVTITNESGAVITTLSVEEGSLITTTSLDLPESFKGFFLEGETCTDDPFDLETPITENLTLIQASFNDQVPCLQLDYIVLSGRPVAGTTLTVDVFPIGANVTISWYTSVNNRTYREIPGENESTYTVRPEDSGKFIRVYVVSDSNPPVVRYDTIKLDVFGTVSNPGTTDNPPSQQIQAIIDQGFIPISSPEDLLAIQSTSLHNFAGVLLTEGGLSKSYALVNHLDLSSYTNLTQGFITGVFSGTLDGNGYTISGLAINSNQSNLALFGQVSGASIESLTMYNFNISGSLTGSNNVGGLIGQIMGGINTLNEITITQSSVQGNIFVGILIGGISSDSVVNISEINFSGEVSGTQQVGGLVGNIFSSQMTIHQVHGTLYVSNSGIDIVGGFVGNINSSSVNISNVSFIAEMHVKSVVGGLIGQSSTSQITMSSVTTHVEISGIDNLGGLIGRSNTSQITISSVSTHVEISGIDNLGGLVGQSSGSRISISKVNAQVDIVGEDDVGGFFGESHTNLNLSISESYITGTNQGIYHIGGFIGYAFRNSNIFIEDSYNLSLVSGSVSHMGGFIGALIETPSRLYILNSYNAGIVNGTSGASIIGLLDKGNVTFSGVYALEGSSLNNVTIGTIYNPVDTSVTGNVSSVSIAQMAALSTFMGWDISKTPNVSPTWSIQYNNQTTYPWLTFMGQPLPSQIISSIPVYLGSDLKTIEDNLFGNFVLENDINLSSYTNLTKSFIDGTFTGELEGNNYRIINLTISASSDLIGVFSELGNEATVQNVTLEAIQISSTSNNHDRYGILAGRIIGNNILITNILVTNSTIEARHLVGGLIGTIDSSLNVTFSQIIHQANVTGHGYHAGGVVADIHNSQVTFHNIVRFGSVHAGSNHAGGILGIGTSSVITLSSIAHYGDVTADGVDAGGLIGQLRQNSQAYILNAFNTGVITNTNTSGTNVDFGQAGGLIGRIGQSGSTASAIIVNAYNMGLVTSGTINKGSIVGEVETSGSSVEFMGVYALNTPSALGSIGATDAGVTVTGNVSSVGIAQMAALSTFDDWAIERYPNSSAIWAIQFNNQTTYPWLSFSNQPQSSQIISTIPVYLGSDLKTIEDNLFGNFVLENDIDLSSYTNLTKSFLDGTFTGNLSGQGFTISGLAINASSNNLGLFNKLGSGAIVQNLTLSGFNITGTGNLGLIAGSIDSSVGVSLISINTTGSHISGNYNVGGLIGEIKNSTAIQMSQLTLNGQLRHSSSNSFHFGGVVGNIENAQVSMEEVLQLGNIEATGNHIGGIVGLIRTSSVVTLSSISQHGNVIGSGSGTTDTGGLIGQVRNSSSVNIQNALNTGNVSNTNNRESGGLIGRVGDGGNFGKVVITNAYNVGTVSSNGGSLGSLIGKIENANSGVTLTAVYYLTGSALNNLSIGAINAGTVTGNISSVSIARMVLDSTFGDWDRAQHPTTTAMWTTEFNGIPTLPWLSYLGSPHSSQVHAQIPVFYPDDLKTIEVNKDKSFILMNNIDLSSYNGQTLSFINTTFTGILSGQGFTISGLKINASTQGIGLFSRLSGANIDNLVIENFNITGTAVIGALAGEIVGAQQITYISNILITNSSIYTSLITESATGGLVGSVRSTNTYISNVHSNARIVAARNFSGGIIGWIFESNVEINQSTFSGIVTGGQRVGGIIGLVNTSTQSSNASNVTLQSISISTDAEITATDSNPNDVGGVIGMSSGSKVAITGSNIVVQGRIRGGGVNFGAFIGLFTSTNSFINITEIYADSATIVSSTTLSNSPNYNNRHIGNLDSPAKSAPVINIP